MHRGVALADPHLSHAAMSETAQPPIGPYHRVPVQVYRADPQAPQVATRLIALLATSWPATPAEHVGSSAVPGLTGKNIIDLLMAAAPADIPAITAALLELGFQHQSPAAFPASRPMLWGTFRHGGPSTGSMCTWSQPPAQRSRPCGAFAMPCRPIRAFVASTLP